MRPEPPEDLGPCCCCGGTERVRNIVCLSRRAPVPGTGWGCLQCGLPMDGAIYLACDRCVDANAPPLRVVAGRGASSGRAPIESLATDVFEHDMSKHPEASEPEPYDDEDSDDWPEVLVFEPEHH